MAYTIKSRWPKRSPPGDRVQACDICGTNYRRAKLRKRPDQLWACAGAGTSNCFKETCSLELDRQNAASARGRTHIDVTEGGSYQDFYKDDPVHYTTADEAGL